MNRWPSLREIRILGGFDGELDAVRVWLEDTQAAVRGTIVGIEFFERGRDEWLPEPHFGLIAERVAFEEPDGGLIDAVALRPRIARFGGRHLNQIESFELMFLR